MLATTIVRQALKSVEMEKPWMREKVSNFIPDDLTFSILSNLSLKSLNRFGCIRKSWALLFENPDFMSLFRKIIFSDSNSYCGDTYLLLNFHFDTNFYDQKFGLYCFSGERFEDKAKLNWPNPFKEDYYHGFDISSSSSINGIICLTTCSEPKPRVVLWNPTTEEFKVIPPSPYQLIPSADVEVQRHGFGYDCVRGDYKVIQRVTYIKESPLGYICCDIFWEIYSLRSNSWRKLVANTPYYEDQGVYQDGVGHWWSEMSYGAGDLVSFDFSNEVFFTTHMPSNRNDSFNSKFIWRYLTVLSGSIALISYCAEMNNFQISILGKLGMSGSWIKLSVVGPSPIIKHPIAVGKNGDIFFRKEDGHLACFYLSNQIIDELGVFGAGPRSKFVAYEENLLPIGEIEN